MAKPDDFAQRIAEADELAKQYYSIEKHNRELTERVAALPQWLREQREAAVRLSDTKLALRPSQIHAA